MCFATKCFMHSPPVSGENGTQMLGQPEPEYKGLESTFIYMLILSLTYSIVLVELVLIGCKPI